MCAFKHFDALPVRRVEAITQIDHRADDRCLLIALPQDLLVGSLNSSFRIAFPKVGFWPKPVEVFVAFLNSVFAAYQLVSDILIASMIS